MQKLGAINLNMRLPRRKEDQPSSFPPRNGIKVCLRNGDKDLESQGTTASSEPSVDEASTTQQPNDTIELSISRFLEDIKQNASLFGWLRAHIPTRKNRNIYDIQSEHLGESRQYWRDIILGVNDGLVSTFLLVAGVTGANLSSTDILLTAIAGTIAGAISMSSGEYIATKTQEEVFDGEIQVERRHIAEHKEKELGELTEYFEKIGIAASAEESDAEQVLDLHQRLLDFYCSRNEAHLAAHIALEFGVLEEEKRNPFIAGALAFFLFVIGALPSVIPFLMTNNVNAAFLWSGILATIGLVGVGAIKTWATRGNLWAASAENLIVSAGGGAIAYGVGVALEKTLRGSS